MTTRVTPVGTKLDDGFPSKITFASDPDVSFWEKTIKPPGVDGGEPVETSTMFNVVMRTMASRQLKTLTPAVVVAAYDPRVYDQIMALCNVENLVTVHFASGQELDFYGYLQKFEPGELAEGVQPVATVTIVPTNVNPSTGAEVLPNYKTSGTGT